MKIPLLNKLDVRKSFNRAATTYDKAAFFEKEIAQRLLERLQIMRIQPQVVLDLGCRTGYTTRLLAGHYPQAQIFAIDFAEKMLLQTKSKHNQKNYICAEAELMPLKSNSIDLIFSNLFLPWCVNLNTAIAEMHRLLKPGGVILFSTLGPDTFKELRASWAMVDEFPHVHIGLDMHHVGDKLLQAQFADPVMDMEYVTLHYDQVRTLLTDIKSLGISNKLQDRQNTLMGKRHFQAFLDQYESLRTSAGKLPLTYEVIYGHAVGVGNEEKADSTEVRIAIDQIRRR